MEIWSIVNGALKVACAVVGGVFAFAIGLGLLWALMFWVCFLLDYPIELMFWIISKTCPPLSSKEEPSRKRAPAPPPPPSLGKEFTKQ